MYTHEFATLQYTAIMNKWTPFISMQNFYNLLYREEEREMNTFCKKMGVGLIPWSPLGRGALARPYQSSDSVRTTTDKMYQGLVAREGASDREIVGRVEKLAKDRGVSMAIVGLAWVLSKGCAPIVGMSKVERIQEAVESLSFKLSDEEVEFLEEAYVPKQIFGIS
jgi:aryl-alcohol dehydrogenase-like predicted oxidoreductase